MIVTPQEMAAAEQAAFKSGITTDFLMDSAARGIAAAVQEFHPAPGRCLVFYGRGNNGGDALAAAALLKAAGWTIEEYPGADIPAETPVGLPARHRENLRAIPSPPPPPPGRATVILDGLLGIGFHGQPRERMAEAIRLINAFRTHRGAWVLALDVPSGLNPETGVPASACVRADATVAIGAVKTGLVADTATDVVGRLLCVPLPQVTLQGRDTALPAFAETLTRHLPPRSFDLHKGQCGRVGIVAGSTGFPGAARLCALGALRGGAGLVTLFVEPALAEVLSVACPPEVMVRAMSDLRGLLSEPLDALAIGPGAGLARRDQFLTLIRDLPCPVVVDADALTALVGHLSLLRRANGPRLLTPHPGEMERLSPREGRSRREWATGFAKTHRATLLLKGARTMIAAPDAPTIFNVSGNPGMASGGMGDTLAGVCAALLAQTHPRSPENLPHLAALAAWLCGRAAERALQTPHSAPESLLASDVANHLGSAFRDLRRDFPIEPLRI